MKKGVAVPYIIAVLLGVAVIGLIGYWLFASGGQFGTGSKEAQCNSDLGKYCSEWLRSGSQPRTFDQSCNTVLEISDNSEATMRGECQKRGYRVPAATRTTATRTTS